MTEQQLNKGIHIADRRVLLADIPEVDPTLVTHGYSTLIDIGGKKLLAPYILVYIDLVPDAPPISQFPIAELALWGYVAPPSAGAWLVSDWQKIGSAIVQDTFKPSLVLIPVVGFDRFACIVKSVTDTPISVRIRMRAISAESSDILLESGMVSKNPPKGKELANVTDGVDGTYYYYVDFSDKEVLGLQIALDGGGAGGGPTGVTATLEATLQDDGTLPAACAYDDVTNQAYGVASFNAAPGATFAALLIPTWPPLFSCCKYIRVCIVAQTNGPDTGDWAILERSK